MNNKHPSESVFGFGIFLAAAYLYIKTAHVFSFYAPDSVGQLLGIDPGVYKLSFGLGAAALVEIIAIAFHYWPRTRHTLVGRLGMWSLLAISGICQVIDGYLVQGTQAQMGEALKEFLTIGVPLVPLYALVLLFAAASPTETEANAEEKDAPARAYVPAADQEPARKQFPGIAPTVQKAWNTVWKGENSENVHESTSPVMQMSQDVPAPALKRSDNGSKPNPQ